MSQIPHKLILFITLPTLLVVGTIYYSLHSAQRLYQGRPLERWVEDLSESKSAAVRERAKAVLTEAAEKAAPDYIQTLRAKDSKFKVMIMNWVGKQHFVNPNFQTADMRRGQAVGKFSRYSVGAIPVLTNLLDDPELAAPAMITLNSTGPQVAPDLIVALVHTNDLVRQYAALGLAGIYGNSVRFRNLVAEPGPHGTFPTNAAVTALVKRLRDGNPNVCASAAFALGQIRAQPQTVIPALIENLAETNSPFARAAAAESLGKYGNKAISAIPKLEKLLNNPVPVVRKAAEKALKFIDDRKDSEMKELTK